VAANPFLGRWRIEEMSNWGRDFLDLVVPAFIEVERETGGSFQFGAVTGWLDYRITGRGASPLAEWSWEGEDEMDPACGRGWARVKNTALVGHLFFHCSEESSFRAVRSSAERRVKERTVSSRLRRPSKSAV
jgi:hypothetical protein